MIGVNHSVSSLEKCTLDELPNDGSDLDLDVPLLSISGAHGHVLQGQLKLHGQGSQLHDLAEADADGNRPDVARRRLPVREDVARIPDVPAVAKEECGDRLKVELPRVRPIVVASN